MQPIAPHATFIVKFTGILLTLVVTMLLSCGAKTGLEVHAPIIIPRIEANCGATIFAQTLETVDVLATPTPDNPELSTEWSIISSRPSEPSISILEQTRTTARITSDRAREVVLQYSVRRLVNDPHAPNQAAQCRARVVFIPDIELSCPDTLSGMVGQTLPIPVSARSRRNRPLTSRWSVHSRPMGPGVMSTSQPNPIDTPPSSLLLDARGRFELDFTVQNDLGESASCRVNLNASAVLAVTCPPDMRLRALQTAPLSPVSITNTTNLPLRFEWDLIPPTPRTSTSQIANAQQRDASLLLDVAGEWVARLRVNAIGGDDQASCSVRITSYYDDDIRVETRWNADGLCQNCGVFGEGQQVQLQLSNLTANNGVYDGTYICPAGGCTCVEGRDMNCFPRTVDWPPVGPGNDPRRPFSNACNYPGPEEMAIRQAVPGTEFGVGLKNSASCRPAIDANREPVVVFVRVYCRGQLQYESETQEIPTWNGSNDRTIHVWRLGQFRYNEDGTCTMRRRCPAGASQSRCIGTIPEIYQDL